MRRTLTLSSCSIECTYDDLAFWLQAWMEKPKGAKAAIQEREVSYPECPYFGAKSVVPRGTHAMLHGTSWSGRRRSMSEAADCRRPFSNRAWYNKTVLHTSKPSSRQLPSQERKTKTSSSNALAHVWLWSSAFYLSLPSHLDPQRKSPPCRQ